MNMVDVYVSITQNQCVDPHTKESCERFQCHHLDNLAEILRTKFDSLIYFSPHKKSSLIFTHLSHYILH